MSKGARTSSPSPARRGTVEWPTLGLAGAIYGGFGLVTWYHALLPWWLLPVFGGYLVAWHGSLQHEVAHGHPTPWPRINEALVLPSLWLWLPFRRYRDSHLRHHRDENLTDPSSDPESWYLPAEAWARLNGPGRAFRYALNTLAGRLLLGPLYCVWCLARSEWRLLRGGAPGQARAWLPHLGGCLLVGGWTVGLCGMSPVTYLLAFAYPGVALTLLRSFLEHRAVQPVAARSVVVEAGPLMALLYLNNNLHALHHAEPGTPWYRLPARYRARRAELLRDNEGYLYRGYGEVVARYLVRAKEPTADPLARGPGLLVVLGPASLQP